MKGRWRTKSHDYIGVRDFLPNLGRQRLFYLQIVVDVFSRFCWESLAIHLLNDLGGEGNLVLWGRESLRSTSLLTQLKVGIIEKMVPYCLTMSNKRVGCQHIFKMVWKSIYSQTTFKKPLATPHPSPPPTPFGWWWGRVFCPNRLRADPFFQTILIRPGASSKNM